MIDNSLNSNLMQEIKSDKIRTQKFNLEEGWLTDDLSPMVSVNDIWNYKRWIAIVQGFDEDGKQKRLYLKESDDTYCVFFVGKKVKEGDILLVGFGKKYSKTAYYKVFAISEEEIELSEPQTTYLKAKKLTKEPE